MMIPTMRPQLQHHLRTFVRLFAIALLLSIPSSVHAHLVTTGLGPVYDGIGHFVLSLDDLLPVIAISLLAGMRGPRPGRFTLFLLPLAWFAGGLFGMQSHPAHTFPIQSISFMVLGVLVASNLRLPAEIVAAIAILLGAIHGYLNGGALSAAGPAAGTLELLGILAVIFVLVALVASFVIWLRWDWTRIAVRVAGSWIAAIGLLLLGWGLRGGNPL